MLGRIPHPQRRRSCGRPPDLSKVGVAQVGSSESVETIMPFIRKALQV